MSTKAPSLKSTKEYRLFTADETNRSPRKLKKIMASMKQWGFLPAHPLAVVANGSRMVIKDGQHRFECAKALGIPVFYVLAEAYSGVSIPELNGAAAGAWNPMDYVQSFCNQGKPEYAKLREFCEESKLPVSISASLLTGVSGGHAIDFVKDGRFQVKDPAFARAVVAVLTAARPTFKFYSHAAFIGAVASALRVQGVTAPVLAERVSKHPELLRHGGTVDGFLEVLEEIFNFRNQSRIALKFLAVEGAKKRKLKGNPR